LEPSPERPTHSDQSDDFSAAVYWGADGAAIDLNTLIDPNSGWLLGAAYDISDSGWIAGTGPFDPDGPGGDAKLPQLHTVW
jgi:hypothetical protein